MPGPPLSAFDTVSRIRYKERQRICRMIGIRHCKLSELPMIQGSFTKCHDETCTCEDVAYFIGIAMGRALGGRE